jgi:hypothetical protein
MRPLQWIAMGLVIVALRTEFGGYDALADPVGWLLVLVGSQRLPLAGEQKRWLLLVAAAAGAVGIALWIPGVGDAIDEVHASLLWVANLPQVGFAALLAHCLLGRAYEAGDTRAAAWLKFLRVGFVAVALLPVLVFGAGVDALELPTYLLATVLLLALIFLLFAWAGRPWAGEPPTRRGPPLPQEERPS